MALDDFYYKSDSYGYIITGLKNQALKNIEIPEGVYFIAKDAFSETNIQSVSFPSSLVTVDDSAFWLCRELESVEFKPDCALSSIGEWSFSACINLKGITLPMGIKSIYCNAFAGCESFTEITIPSSVTLMKACVFEDCYDLKTIYLEFDRVPSTWHMYWNESQAEVVYTKEAHDETKSVIKDSSHEKIVTKKSPSVSVKSENDKYLSMFILDTYEDGYKIVGLRDDEAKIEELVIPQCVLAIGVEAFKNRTELKRVICHKDLKIIYPRAFYGCTSLSAVEISPKTAILNEAFRLCSAIESLTVDGYAHEGAFAECGVKNVTLDKSLDTVKSHLFYGCDRLEEINLHENITYISDHAFTNCTKLKKVNFSSNIEYIEDEAFMGCTSLTEAVLPVNLTWLMSGAFLGCTKLKSVKINSRLGQLRSGTFLMCESLKSITIPKNIYCVEENTFDGRFLKEVIIEKSPDSCHRIPTGWDEGWICNNEDGNVKITFVNA